MTGESNIISKPCFLSNGAHVLVLTALNPAVR